MFDIDGYFSPNDYFGYADADTGLKTFGLLFATFGLSEFWENLKDFVFL